MESSENNGATEIDYKEEFEKLKSKTEKEKLNELVQGFTTNMSDKLKQEYIDKLIGDIKTKDIDGAMSIINLVANTLDVNNQIPSTRIIENKLQEGNPPSGELQKITFQDLIK